MKNTDKTKEQLIREVTQLKVRISKLEKYETGYKKAEKTFQTAGHLVYVTYPLIRDKKLLLKILLEIKNSIASCINSILQYEYLYQRIRLSDNHNSNFKTFIKKCSPRYKISETDCKLIIKLFDIAEKHKNSPFEFVKDEKVIILSENMNSETITLEKVKEFLEMSKKVLNRAKDVILR